MICERCGQPLACQCVEIARLGAALDTAREDRDTLRQLYDEGQGDGIAVARDSRPAGGRDAHSRRGLAGGTGRER